MSPLSFEFSISREKFYRLVKPVSPRVLGNPHFVCCFGIVAGLSQYIASEGGNIPIEFIFDTQSGVSDDIDLFFDFMTKDLPADARKLIRGKPRFEDDRQLLSLQAADMLAWHLRREHENQPLPMADLLRAPGHLLCMEINESTMKRWAEHHSHLLGISSIQSKSQWQAMKKELTRLQSLGFMLPHDANWKNTLKNLARFIRRVI